MDIPELTSRPPRYLEIAFGVVSLIFGITLLLISSFAYYRLWQRGINQNAAVISGMICLIGIMLTSAGFRLMLSRHRADSGLLSPLVLFAGGVFFLGSPFVIYFLQPAPMLGVAFNFVAGVACFSLWWRRVRSPRGLGT
jgi:hypothetical protein